MFMYKATFIIIIFITYTVGTYILKTNDKTFKTHT